MAGGCRDMGTQGILRDLAHMKICTGLNFCGRRDVRHYVGHTTWFNNRRRSRIGATVLSFMIDIDAVISCINLWCIFSLATFPSSSCYLASTSHFYYKAL